jgi:hypothetical protein
MINTNNEISSILSIQTSSIDNTNRIGSFLTNLAKLQEDKTTSTISKSDSLDYENIKNLSLEDINTVFTDSETKSKAINLKLATMFSNDNNLSKAMYNTVLGQAFDVGYNYLFNSYEDKNVFLNSNSNNLADLLHNSITSRQKNNNSTDVISQDRLDEILTVVNSFNFVSALANTSKDKYDRYKDEDNDYSFLYNDYNLKYQELLYKYNEIDNINKNIIKQY